MAPRSTAPAAKMALAISLTEQILCPWRVVGGSSTGTDMIILNFHGVGAPARTLEPGEDRYWIDEVFFSSILDLLAHRDRQMPVAITFDDGNVSDLETCAPILGQHGYRATFFMLAGRLDQPGSLSSQGLRDLIAEGHAVGTHGYDHVDWRRLDDASSRRELVEAREALENAIGGEIREAAIPFGAYDRGVLTRLRAASYNHIYTSDGGPASAEAWLCPRVSIRKDMTPDDVAAILSGKETLARRMRRRLAMLKKRLA